MKVIKRNDWDIHLVGALTIEMIEIFTAPTQLTNEAISVDNMLAGNHLKFYVPFWSLLKRRCYVYYADSTPHVHIPTCFQN